MEKLKNKKVIILLVVIAVAMILIAYGVSYALLSSNDAKNNEFSPSNNQVEIEEEYEAPKKLVPGSVITKTPRISNVGNEDAYVRARVLFSNNDAEAICDPLSINSDWTFISGWYYYEKVLKVGQKSQTIFDRVVIKSDISESEIIDFEIIIYVESVNSEGHSNFKSAFGI